MAYWKEVDCSCKFEYSIENRGDGYALYFGRCVHRHGYNLANLSEVDLPRLEILLALANSTLPVPDSPPEVYGGKS